MISGSNLEQILAAGHFAVTAELGPPMDCDPAVVTKKAEQLQGMGDAFNVTDNQTAVVRMSSISASLLMMQQGIEPVMQMTCRDRNRLAIQSDILGATALGIRNCLCIAGDHQSFGSAGRLKGHPGAKNVYDVDSIQLLSILKGMRDDGQQQGGDPLEHRPPIFIGAAWTPLGDPIEIRPLRLKKKVAAGANFIQTQGIFDMPGFREQMEIVCGMGLHEQTCILGGVIVPRSLGMLKYMNSSVAGVTVPESLMTRMAAAKDAAGKDKKQASRNQAQEGIKIAVELIEQLRETPGVRGVHIQAIEWEHRVPEIVEKAGLLPRPAISQQECEHGSQSKDHVG
jgi:methylenetetrahydrofolate reductase (NADPH)